MFFQLNINNIEPRHTSLARHHQQTRQRIWKVAWEWLWTVTDLISVFLRADPFSLRFPYIFRLLNFYFDTEYYAILMSNSFTLIHFRTLARPLQFLLFAFHSKLINIIFDLFLLLRLWKQRQQSIVPWRTASRHGKWPLIPYHKFPDLVTRGTAWFKIPRSENFKFKQNKLLTLRPCVFRHDFEEIQKNWTMQ